jgi:sulfoxide reductase heme-binding subunit YedZ
MTSSEVTKQAAGKTAVTQPSRRPALDRDTRRKLLRWAMHAAALFPLAWLIFDYWFGFLGPEPVRAIILRTGKAAIILLVLSLAMTPATILFGWKYAATLRKPLGLYGFMYVCLHLLTFVWLDYGFVLPLIVEEIVARRYALVGFLAFVLLVPLAITSNKYSMKKLGKNWKKLHTLVYLIGVLAVVHYIWLVKNAYTQPLIFAAILAVLLFVRLPAVRQWLIQTRRKLEAKLRAARQSAA